MNTRALMALVVINIGADMGVISPAAFFWLVTMALFTTVITTPILTRAYPSPEAAGGWERGRARIGPRAVEFSKRSSTGGFACGRPEDFCAHLPRPCSWRSRGRSRRRGSAAPITLAVDASDAPRRIFHVQRDRSRPRRDR